MVNISKKQLNGLNLIKLKKIKNLSQAVVTSIPYNT